MDVIDSEPWLSQIKNFNMVIDRHVEMSLFSSRTLFDLIYLNIAPTNTSHLSSFNCNEIIINII